MIKSETSCIIEIKMLKDIRKLLKSIPKELDKTINSMLPLKSTICQRSSTLKAPNIS